MAENLLNTQQETYVPETSTPKQIIMTTVKT